MTKEIKTVTIIDRDFEDRCEGETSEIIKEKAEEIANMYDDPPPQTENGMYGQILREGLTENELKLAPLYASLAIGMMVVTGTPGSGKGVFSNHLAFRLRRMFENKRVLLDYKPTSVFDLGNENNRYIYFNTELLTNEIGKMAEKSDIAIIGENGTWKNTKKLTKQQMLENTRSVASKWAKSNEIILLNAVMLLDEFKRYFHNRNPMNPLGITLGHVVSVWRHLGILILGMCPYLHEIDQFSIHPYMSHEIKCSSAADGRTFFADYYRKKSITSKGVVNVEGRPVRIKVDGRAPLPEVGVELLDYEYPESDFGNKERAIVDYLQSCPKYLANINQINRYVDEDLNTLNKRLLFLHDLNVVECKTFFDIFNSKNLTNLSPK